MQHLNSMSGHRTLPDDVVETKGFNSLQKRES